MTWATFTQQLKVRHFFSSPNLVFFSLFTQFYFNVIYCISDICLHSLCCVTDAHMKFQPCKPLWFESSGSLT